MRCSVFGVFFRCGSWLVGEVVFRVGTKRFFLVVRELRGLSYWLVIGDFISSKDA